MEEGGARARISRRQRVACGIALWLGLVSFACTALGQEARAHPRLGTETDDESAAYDLQRLARSLFDSGTVAFRQLRYEDALESFVQAYELTHDPVLLFSIGMSHDRLYRLPEAIVAFEAYLRAMPDARNRPAAEERIRTMRAHIDQGDAKPSTAESSVVPPPAQAGAPAAHHVPTSPVPATPGGERRAHRLHPAVFWAGTGIGAGLVGAAIWSGTEFKRASDDYARNPTAELANEGSKIQRRANALIGCAATMAAVTAVVGIFFTDWHADTVKSDARKQSGNISAWVTRDGRGVSWSRTF